MARRPPVAWSQPGRALPLAALAVACLAGSREGQFLVKIGDDVPGLGPVVQNPYGACNASGQWAARVVSGDAFSLGPFGLLLDGALVQSTGDPLPSPPGAVVEFTSVHAIDDLGRVLSSHDVDPLLLGSEMRVYLGDSEIAAQGSVSTAPGAGGAVYGDFSGLAMNDAGRVLALTRFEGAIGVALVAFDVDAAGTVLQESVLFESGDVLPGVPQPLDVIAPGAGQLAVTEAGVPLFVGILVSPTFEFDAAVFLGSTKLFRDGEPSPVPGRPWFGTATAMLDANDLGDWVVNGRVEGPDETNGLLVVNGVKIVQEGDMLPDIAPFRITNLGLSDSPLGSSLAQPFLTNAGEVVWWGEWDDPDDTRNSGIFVDHRLLIHFGVTTMEGEVLFDVGPHPGFLTVEEDSGWATLVTLEGEAGLLRFRAAPAEFTPYSGCAPNAGKLSFAGGDAVLGGTLQFALDDGQVPGAVPFLGGSLGAAPGYPPCGAVLPGVGELLLDVSATQLILVKPSADLWTGAPVSIDLSVPDDASFLGLELFLQGMFFDPQAAPPAEALRLTNGIEFGVGT
ncbi:MAG: hypothetical protein AAF682_07985 [Planctomycetota bacterium]